MGGTKAPVAASRKPSAWAAAVAGRIVSGRLTSSDQTGLRAKGNWPDSPGWRLSYLDGRTQPLYPHKRGHAPVGAQGRDFGRRRALRLVAVAAHKAEKAQR